MESIPILSKENWRTLNNKKGAQTVFHIMYEVTRKMADLNESTRFRSAEEKYTSLISNYPAILQRVSLGQIASYLGITQETLNDTIAVMTNHLASTIIKNNPPDILIEISKKSCRTYDFYKAEELVEMGRYAAREKLNSLQD